MDVAANNQTGRRQGQQQEDGEGCFERADHEGNIHETAIIPQPQMACNSLFLNRIWNCLPFSDISKRLFMCSQEVLR